MQNKYKYQNYDYQALHQELNKSQINNYSTKINYFYPKKTNARGIAYFATGTIFTLIALAILSIIIITFNGQANLNSLVIPLFVGFILIFIICSVTLLGWVLSDYKAHKHHDLYITKRKRIQDFADSNKISIKRSPPLTKYSGMIFDSDGTEFYERYSFPDLDQVEIGNYSFFDKSGGGYYSTHGYVKIILPRKLPHLFIDSRSNNSITKMFKLPVDLDIKQILKLEGNFNDHFDLYAPKEYDTDALYILTPDVMAALIDHCFNYDIEITDDQLYIYSLKEFDLSDETFFKELLNAVETLDFEIRHQSKNYTDTRVLESSLNIIENDGKKLRQSDKTKIIHQVAMIIGVSSILTILFISNLLDDVKLSSVEQFLFISLISVPFISMGVYFMTNNRKIK